MYTTHQQIISIVVVLLYTKKKKENDEQTVTHVFLLSDDMIYRTATAVAHDLRLSAWDQKTIREWLIETVKEKTDYKQKE